MQFIVPVWIAAHSYDAVDTIQTGIGAFQWWISGCGFSLPAPQMGSVVGAGSEKSGSVKQVSAFIRGGHISISFRYKRGSWTLAV